MLPCLPDAWRSNWHFADNLAAPAFVGYWGNSGQTSSAPRRLEIRHRLLAARRIASIMRVLRHPRRDRPEPAAIFRRGVGPQDAPDVPVAVEHVVVVVRPLAVGRLLEARFSRSMDQLSGDRSRDRDTTRRACARLARMLPRVMGEMLICRFLALRK